MPTYINLDQAVVFIRWFFCRSLDLNRIASRYSTLKESIILAACQYTQMRDFLGVWKFVQNIHSIVDVSGDVEFLG